MQEPEKTRMPTSSRIACIYTKENVYFSTAAQQSDVTLYNEKDAVSNWVSSEIIAVYKGADRFRLKFSFEQPLFQVKTIPLDRIPAHQIDVNADEYVSVKDLDTGASYRSIEELRDWVRDPDRPSMGPVVSFRLYPGMLVRFRMNTYVVGGVDKCALNLLGPIC
ncbi:Hypothetical protein GSB_152678 [Giardia duodenalis]|uniref:Uncharacterized protein n=2 Tax=Giardia intestinalis TaxID=5741 RepID=C6LN14_GIAIB|nr:Hypothetical protein GL50581_114 [Giardia intestinalis ATCC 50581]ESU43087.1 Hypothetical protein GSB_152678 [Giardia intestinalis]